jgi:hypothetical protein
MLAVPNGTPTLDSRQYLFGAAPTGSKIDAVLVPQSVPRQRERVVAIIALNDLEFGQRSNHQIG